MKYIKLPRTALLFFWFGLLAMAGCASSEPDRLPVDVLVADNGGLQSKDVQAATDQMATSLLALPQLNASDHKWTIVIIDPVNQTTNPYSLQYNVFSNRLKSVLMKKSQGRVDLIDNKTAFHNLQNQELEAPPGGYPAGVQPDYALTLTVNEMPSRVTSYYQVNAQLTNLAGRVIYWNDAYEIQATR